MSTFWQRYPVFILLLPLVAYIIAADALGWPLWGRQNAAPVPTDTTLCWSFLVSEQPLEHAKTKSTETAGVLLYMRKDSTRPAPQMGDSIRVCARLRDPEVFGRFDYPSYLRRKGISAIGYAGKEDWQVIAHTPPHGPRHWQQVLTRRLAQILGSDKEYGTVAALTLGWRDDLDDDIRLAFQRAGAMHVLAVSGLHTGILMSVLWMLLTGFGKWRPLYEQRGRICLLYLTLCILLWLYAALTGWSPSVVRSVLMASIGALAVVTRRQAISINTIALAALIILTFRPSDLFAVGFQLSFAAVTAIILFTSSELYIMLQPPTMNWWMKPIRWVVDLMLISLAAWLGTLPLTLLYYGQTATYFLMTNLIVIPAATVLVSLTLALLTIGWLPLIGTALGWVVKWAAWSMNTAVGWIEHLPGSTLSFDISGWMAMGMYGFMLSAYLTMHRNRLRYLIPAAASCAVFILTYYHS